MLFIGCIYVLAYILFGVLALPTSDMVSFLPGELETSELDFLIHDPPVTHKVVFEISKKIDKDGVEKVLKLGDITFGLFGSTAPKTVKNFLHLACMQHGYGYIGSSFHRIIGDFMVQGGDFTNGDGTGGHSIYNKEQFPDETFAILHDKIGRLSMANSGPNTNGGQFFITTREFCQWLDGMHVVFGQLIDGLDILQQLSYVETDQNNKPLEDIYISNSYLYQLPLDSTLAGYFKNTVVNDLIEAEDVNVITYYPFFLLCTFIALIGLFYLKRYYKRQLVKDIQNNKNFY